VQKAETGQNHKSEPFDSPGPPAPVAPDANGDVFR
jgi:hypothetical protein